MPRTYWRRSSAAALLILAGGCTTVPITGQRVCPWMYTAKTTQPEKPEQAVAAVSAPVSAVTGGQAPPPVTAEPPVSEASPKPRVAGHSLATVANDELAGAWIRQVEGNDVDLTEGAPLVLAEASDLSATPPAPAAADNGVAIDLPPSYTLNLANVLYLTDAQNPTVALARERINEAYARVDRAEVLWLPSIRAGLNYTHHEGQVQDVAGNVFNVNKSVFYGGLGAVGGGSGSPVVPGLVAQFHLTDAIFQPKIQGHQASSRQFAATAARNDALRNTAVAYLELVRAEQALAIAEEALDNTRKLADLTGNYAETGQGLRSDHERMLAELAIRKTDVVRRIETVRVASARLAQLLHTDPSVRISSGEPMVVPLDLHVEHATSAEYVSTALSRRPELAEQKHLVCEAIERLNREKYAPLVPSVLLGFSYAGMGGGIGSSIINSGDRWDADAAAFWEVRNLGFGERAARNEASSLIRQTQRRELAILDQVAREAVEAHSQVVERERQIPLAQDGISAAERSYALNENRIENAQGLPIEVLQSIQALAAARQNYLSAVVDYNIAQFELCRAIGWFEEG